MNTLLFVEDDLVVLEDLATLADWEAEGYQVFTAVNGRQGLRRFEECQPQIIVTDIKMPLMDGLEMMQAIRQRSPHVQFMILSAYEDFAYLQEAIHLGAGDYIRKTSINRQSMLEKVNALARRWQEEASNALAILKGQFQELRAGAAADCGGMRAICAQFPPACVLEPFAAYAEKELAQPLPRDQGLFDVLERHFARCYSDVVDRAVAEIQARYGDCELTNADIAAAVGMSERRLAERFREETGRTINDHITMTRMEAAKKLLQSGHMIYETAALTGYSTPQYFGSVFKRCTGMTPNEYRTGEGK